MIQMMLTGTQWDYNAELYPSGGQDFVAKMGNLSMTYYTNGFNSQSPYCNVSRYNFVKANGKYLYLSSLLSLVIYGSPF